VWRQTSETGADPAKPWRPGADVTPDKFPVTVLVYPYADRYIDGEMIRTGDAKGYLASKDLAFVPVPGDFVAFNTTELWRVVDVKTLQPGEDRILYELQLRS
jgi:hypothetical protein